jgi:Tfp pilus assembly protein PilX
MNSKMTSAKRGLVFITVILMATVLETMLGVVAYRQIQEQRLLQYDRMKTETFYLAQGAIERGVDNLARSTTNFEALTFPLTQTVT